MKKFIKVISPIILFLYLTIRTGSICAQVFQQDIKSDTSWKYLGQVRPGLTPLRFPPDSLLANNNWMWHGTPIFSPDLKEMFWCKYNHVSNRGELVFIKYINGNWTPMQNTPFGNLNYFENNPHYSITGDTLFFVSLRPVGFIFRVIRQGTGWTEPAAVNIPIPSGYFFGLQFSIARNGSVYFELSNNNNQTDIYKSRLVNSIYQTPEHLGFIINSDSSDICPYIDPYERFIIFASKRPGGYGLHDIYVSKRNPDNTWNTPINLGPAINSSTEEAFPSITPDSMYFFYETGRNQPIGYNPFWVNIQYIYNIAAIGIQKSSEEIPSSYLLLQNYPNPFNPLTKIEFSIPQSSAVNLTVYDITGKVISTLVNGKLHAGTYKVDFNGGNLSTGIYFYKLEAVNYFETKKMILLK